MQADPSISDSPMAASAMDKPRARSLLMGLVPAADRHMRTCIDLLKETGMSAPLFPTAILTCLCHQCDDNICGIWDVLVTPAVAYMPVRLSKRRNDSRSQTNWSAELPNVTHETTQRRVCSPRP